jgi:hypothetical protein
MSDEREDAVERVLAALGRARVPDGLEARIAQRLERREIVAGPSMMGAWWRGAVTGTAFAMVCVGLVMLVQHGLRVRTQRGPIAVRIGAGAIGTKTTAIPVEARERPCGSESFRAVREGRDADARSKMQVANAELKKPFVAAPLTAEERELVRLARTADPRELATLNPEVRAKLDAEEAASFQSFFAAPKVKPAAAEEPSTAEPAAAEPSGEVPVNEPTSALPAKSEPSTKASTGESQ